MSDIIEYKVLSHVDHVLQRPEQYVGSVVTRKEMCWVFDIPSKKMIQKEIIHNEGLMKIINEVIDNAVDNSKRKINPTTIIKMTMNNEKIVISNDGCGIPINITDLGNGENMYIPTTIFGVPMSGSKFNDNCDGIIGTHGMGVKLSNIFSKEFKVICINDNKKFKQIWKNNMKDRQKEIITKAPATSSFTTSVSFTPDLSYFYDESNTCNITSLKDIEDMIYTRLFTISVSHPDPIKIYFNGKQMKCKGLKAYMKLFTNDRTLYDISPIGHFEYGVALSTTGSFEHQSFVNCHHTTSDKSTQTRYVTNKICSVVTDYFKKKKSASGKIKLSNNYIANYLHVFVNMQIMNPKFTGQTKVELSSNISPKLFPMDSGKILGIIKKSGLLARLETELQRKVLTTVQDKLNTSSKSSSINIPKLDDAHDAGTAKSVDTMLFLVEGDSAKTMVSTGMSVIGRKKYGVFPLKGKVLNVIGATPKQLAENKEIVNIMKIVGLNFNRKYDTAHDMKTLRYNRLCAMCDSDNDGYHITGLLIAFINHFWPALLRNGFLTRFVTPIIKITKRNTTHVFFTLSEYLSFEDKNDMSGWTVKHIKGLGTARKEETLEYFSNMKEKHLKDFIFSDDTSSLIRNIFDPTDSNWRKDWLSRPMTTRRMDYNDRRMEISKFLMTEMYDYSLYNIKRAIPSAIDGFKVSQRKVICTCLDKFKNVSTSSIKVSQLASYTAAYTNYAHGEVSLQNTIVNMAQSFSGSNNIPFLFEDGAFGTRILNGKDAASARYIFTKFNPYATSIITETSPSVLSYIIDENVTVEPEFYVPSLPMVLINGANGIATGFRSLVPSFNPKDIIQNIKCKFDKELLPVVLVPWYGGTYKTNHKTTSTNNIWTFEGQVDIGEKNTVVISELPIGISIDHYKDTVLAKMVASKLIQKFIVDHVSENEPKFIIYGYTGKTDNMIETFKLRHTLTKKCMNLLDKEGRVQNFSTPEDILDYWFNIRQEYVEKSHTNKCNLMDSSMQIIQHKINFIQAVVNKNIEIRNTTKVVVEKHMKSLGIPQELFQKFLQIPLISITQERYLALENELVTMKKELISYKNISMKSIIMSEMDFEIITTMKGKKRKKMS